MSLNCILSFFALLTFTAVTYADTKPDQFEKVQPKVSLQDQDDLAFASGHYSLEQGNSRLCPDGEFTGGKGFLVVGASQKIDNINKGSQTTIEDCFEVREAYLKLKKLTFTQFEDCGQESYIQTVYNMRFYQSPTKAFIDLDIKNSQSLSKFGFQGSLRCLYSRML